ncbi:MAG: hypothetical protein ISS91_02060 [Candidatus Omnitrophica bacterium]|nr:hypothetical protein [Candidatus Omnitrophota bacterium]
MTGLITILDLGCDRLAACLGSIHKKSSLSIFARESAPSRGIKDGAVIDAAMAIEEITALLSKLRRKNKRVTRGVHVTITGSGLSSQVSRSVIPLARIPREISKKDIKKCINIASLVRLPPDRAIVQKIVKGYSVDSGALNIVNPLGLYGIKLESEMLLLTASLSHVDTISKVIDHSGFFLEKFHLASLAKSYSLLDERDKDAGAILLDVGTGISEAAVYKNKSFLQLETIKKGTGFFINSDTTLNKEKLGTLLSELFKGLDLKEKKDVASLVITGKGALLDGMIEEAERVTKIPARLGAIKRAPVQLNSEDSIVHAATIGLLYRIAEEYRFFDMTKNPIQKTLHKLIDIYESYF